MTTCLLLLALGASAGQSLISEGSPVRFLVPTSDIGAGWRAPGFDDAAWTPGINGVGYESLPQEFGGKVIADSAADWSFQGRQGENNWINGYYNYSQDADKTYQAGDFQPFPRSDGPWSSVNFWDGGSWNWSPDNIPWDSIGQTAIHPNGTNSIGAEFPIGEEHWAIRRWRSPVSGWVTARFYVAKGNTSGNGVTGKIFKNGTELFSRSIAGSDTGGFTVYVPVQVAAGDYLDFVHTPLGLGSDGNDGSDGSNLSARILEGQIVAPVATTDTLAGWGTGAQGENGWFYGFYNKTADADGIYSPATDFNNTDPNWTLAGNWTLGPGDPPWDTIGQTDWHPNGDNNGHIDWVIKRWVSTINGDINCNVQFGKQNTGGGNGTTLHVLHNGVEKFARSVVGTDGVGFTADVVVTGVQVGDFIEFALDPMGPNGAFEDGADGSRLVAAIYPLASYLPSLRGNFQTDIQAQMQGVNSSVYLRLPFNVANPAEIESLKLKLRWNDGYAAYLNGVIVDKKNAPTVITGTTYADSIAEWSSTGAQGENNWFNGYYDRGADADGMYDGSIDFRFFPHDGMGYSPTDFWNGSGWDWYAGNPPWTELYQETTHPNGVNSGSEQWVVRRWVSEVDSATLKCRFKFRKTNPNCGDGVVGYIYVNGILSGNVEVYRRAIDGTDAVGRDDTVDLPELLVGDYVDIMLSPNTGNDFCDGSAFSATIFEGQPSVAWDAAATARRTATGSSAAADTIDLTGFLGELVAGNNVLAIQGLNISASDADFLLSAELIANRTPVAVADNVTAIQDFPAAYPGALLLANDTDADGDALQIVGVNPDYRSANGGTVRLYGQKINYMPPPAFVGVDSFIYTMTDASGIPAVGTVNVNVEPRVNLTNWIVFNDHIPVPTPNVNGYDMMVGPGGPLVNWLPGEYGAGEVLPIAMAVAPGGGVAYSGAMSNPDPGTPAYNLFNGIVDLANTPNPGILQTAVGDTTTLTFTGLDPAMRYSVRLTSVRGRETDPTTDERYTVCSLLGVDGFVDAHSVGVVTKATVAAATLTPNQAAYNSGRNKTVGAVVGWDDISPGPDGTFAILSDKYTGPINDSGATANGAYGYAPCGVMLMETGFRRPVEIAVQPPAETVVGETRPFTLVARGGGTAPHYQWYKEGSGLIPGATGPSYTVAAAAVSDTGNYYVVVNNSFSSAVSGMAHVEVIIDEVPPVALSASGSATFDTITILFSEKLDALTAEDEFNYSVIDSVGNLLNVANAALSANQLTVTITLDASTPQAENTLYTVTLSGVSDLVGNPIEPGSTVQFSSFVTGGGGLLFEFYGGTGGGVNVADLTNNAIFPNSPTERRFFTRFDTVAELGTTTYADSFGARVRGLFIPPVSGNWVFYLSSDDASQLFLNPNNASAAGKVLIASETGCCKAYSAIRSAVYPLQGGRAYYIEGLYKEGGGGDYLGVVAKLATDPAPNCPTAVACADAIAGAMVGYPAAPPGAAGNITISQQPSSLTVQENHAACFSVVATSTYGVNQTYQWRKNGIDIPGANGPTYCENVTSADDGAAYSVLIAIVGDKVLSADAVLSVTVDDTPPTIVSAKPLRTLNQVLIQFSERMDRISAEDWFNYTVPAGYSITGITLSADETAATLTLDQILAPDATSCFQVNSVTDIAGNPIDPNPTDVCVAVEFVCCFARQEIWKNIGGGVLVSDLTSNPAYPDSPTEVRYKPSLEANTADEFDNYGTRISGWLKPPVSGNYNFAMSADDGAELWLSTDANPQNRVRIAFEPIWNGRRDWVGTTRRNPAAPENRSSTLFPDGIPLVAGQYYYFEALMKEGGGGDNLGATWQIPGEPAISSASQPISGLYIAQLFEPVGASLTITQQPADALFVLSTGESASGALLTEDFTANDGGFTVQATGRQLGPWAYSAGTTSWRADGNDPCGDPGASYLTSPAITVASGGPVVLNLRHRYSFEFDGTTRWDGGQVRLSVNGGPFNTVPQGSFTANGYVGIITGNGVLNGQPGFNGDSSGYGAGTFIVSTANLGSFNAGDVLALQFVAMWDECTRGSLPNWEIDRVEVSGEAVHNILSENFNSGNGGFTVDTPQAYEGPWVYNAAGGLWSQDGQAAENSRPNTSKLNSPAVQVTVPGSVRLTFVHKYSFESGFWDGGQVRVSVNGGPYTAVPAAAFVTNGYNGTVLGNSASQLAGQAAFVQDSPGYSAGYITSVADLGAFAAGDTVSVQFMAASDTNTRGQVPNWAIDSVTLADGIGQQTTVTFNVRATSQFPPNPAQGVTYQWQRNSGAGWYNLAGATTPTYTFAPVLADNGAQFRAILCLPTIQQYSEVATLTVVQPNTAPRFTKGSNQVVSEDGGPVSVAGWASDIQVHNFTRTPVVYGSDFASGPLTPQQRTFSADFGSTPVGVTLNGSASVTDGALHLTTAANDQQGSLIVDSLVGGGKLTAFDMNFKMRIGGGTTPPADGMSVCVGPDVAGAFGEEGVGSGLIVSFDIWDNTDSDPNNGTGEAPRIDVKWAGTELASTLVPLATLVTDPNFIPVNIKVEPDGTLDVIVNGNAVYSNLQLPLTGPVTAAKFGIGGRTGGANANHWVDDLNIVAETLQGTPAPSGSALAGHAYIADGALHLTDAANSAYGSFTTTPIPGQIDSYNVSFKLAVGGGTCCGDPTSGGPNTTADGMSVNIATDLPAPGVAEDGEGSGLSICFDTWDSGGGEAPAIDVKWQGATLATYSIQVAQAPAPAVPAFVPVSIDVDSAGRVTVTYDGAVIHNNVQIPLYRPQAGLRLGMAARTGGANQAHWVDDLMITAYPPDASSAEAGQTVQFLVSNNNPALFSAQPAVAPNGTLTYTAAPDACGQAVVTVVAQDDGGTAYGGRDTSAPQTFTITVNPVNDCPVAVDVAVATQEDVCVTGPLAAAGSDADAASGCGPSTLSVVVITPPANGVVTVNGGAATYCPAPDFCGTDAFRYALTDGVCQSEVKVVTITVLPANDCPVAASQSVSACEDTAASIVLQASDADVNSCMPAVLTFSIVAPPAHGTLVGAAPNLTYVPAADYNGPDSFTYRVSDGICEATGVVSIEVRPVNDPPVCDIVIGPLVKFSPDQVEKYVLSGNNVDADVVLDASLSTDIDSASLSYVWLVDGMPVGTGAILTNKMPVGSHQVTLVVDDGGTGTAPGCVSAGSTCTKTDTVTVISGSQAVEEIVLILEETTLDRKTKRPFIATLKASESSFDRLNCISGVNQLEAFINKVQSQIAKEDPMAAAELIYAAEAAIAAFEQFGCSTP